MPALLVVAVSSIWIIVAWLFARVPGLVYDLALWQRAALHLAYEGFVTPLANKFIVALCLALGMVHWQWNAQQASPKALGVSAATPHRSPANARVPRAAGAPNRGEEFAPWDQGILRLTPMPMLVRTTHLDLAAVAHSAPHPAL